MGHGPRACDLFIGFLKAKARPACLGVGMIFTPFLSNMVSALPKDRNEKKKRAPITSEDFHTCQAA